jgi:transposase-like protein
MGLNQPDSHETCDGRRTRFTCSSDDGAWQVVLDAASHSGRTTTDVLAVSLTRAADTATRYAAWELLAEVARKTPEWVSDRRAAEVLGDLALPDGRANALFRAEIASAYVELVSLDVAKPVEWIQHRLGLTSPHPVFSWLRQARDEKLLTSAGAGKAGGHLTKKARDLLGEAAKQTGADQPVAPKPNKRGLRRV